MPCRYLTSHSFVQWRHIMVFTLLSIKFSMGRHQTPRTSQAPRARSCPLTNSLVRYMNSTPRMNALNTVTELSVSWGNGFVTPESKRSIKGNNFLHSSKKETCLPYQLMNFQDVLDSTDQLWTLPTLMERAHQHLWPVDVTCVSKLQVIHNFFTDLQYSQSSNKNGRSGWCEVPRATSYGARLFGSWMGELCLALHASVHSCNEQKCIALDMEL